MANFVDLWKLDIKIWNSYFLLLGIYTPRWRGIVVMMTSSNGKIFRVTGPLCGEFTGPGQLPAQRPVTRSFDVFFDLCLNNGWLNNREAGDLRRHRAHFVQCHNHLPICPLWACPCAKNLSNPTPAGSRLCGTHISETAEWIYTAPFEVLWNCLNL